MPLRCWYNSTIAGAARRRRRSCGAGTQFTTAEVLGLLRASQFDLIELLQLVSDAEAAAQVLSYAVYYCVPGTTVQILTQQAMHPSGLWRSAARSCMPLSQCTCFTGTKLYWYNSTNTDAAGYASCSAARSCMPRSSAYRCTSANSYFLFF